MGDIERYESRIAPADKNGCCVWTRSVNKAGYGQFEVGGVCVQAHRFGFTARGGALTPEKPQVLHKCDNPPCQTQEHLFAGNDLLNARDRASKDRGNRPVQLGELNNFVRLTEADAIWIRATYTGGRGEIKEMAAKLGVHRSTVSLVLSGTNWKDTGGSTADFQRLQEAKRLLDVVRS